MTATPEPHPGPDLMTPGEVGALFRVDAKTVSRWELKGKFPEGTVIRTPGGHRRYRADAVRSMLTGGAS